MSNSSEFDNWRKFPISVDEATRLSLRHNGSPSNADIDLLRRNCGDKVGRDDFISWHTTTCMHEDDTAHQFANVINQLKPSRDSSSKTTIFWDALKRILTNAGECLSEKEFIYLATEFTHDGVVDFDALANL